MYNCKIYHNLGDSTSMTLHNKDLNIFLISRLLD